MKPGSQFIFAFEEGDGKDKMLLGGKGANLCEMTQIGLNVPPGFVISTEACLAYLKHDHLPEGLMDSVLAAMHAVEQKAGKIFGSAENPLLVSVRSGSSMSMPGMMDTVLNLGLNKTTLQGLIKQTGNARFAYDAHRRFIQLFGKIALGVSDEHFDAAMAAMKKKTGVSQDVDLSAEHLAELADQFAAIVQKHTGQPFPEDPAQQLEIAIGAVFRSWNGKRAIDYRKQFKITPAMASGTAVNICTMVFGNMGNDSGTGVGFTRNPGTGENSLYGEYLVNAQGEDVVAGIRTPKALAEMEQEMPEIYRQLTELRSRLETHYKEVQDFEFTIERGRLYCLQTRNGKMNAQAMVRTSVEMFKEGLISKEKALLRIDPAMLEQLLVPQLAPSFRGKPLATGLPASPGAASGKIVFDADSAEQRGNAGEKIILVREETKPEDIHGFFQAQGILTSRGGKTSHAAVVEGYILFVRDNALAVQPFDEQTLETRGDVLAIGGGATSGEGVRAFSLSSAGVLAYQVGPVSDPARSRLVWLDRSGQETGMVGEPADYGDLALSPNGSSIAASVRAPGAETGDIVVLDVETGAETAITADAADDTAPVWSPDGRRILFASARAGGKDIFQKAAAGTGSEVAIVDGEGDQIAYDWSSDGRYLLYQTNQPRTAAGGNFDLWARMLPGGPSFAYFRTIREATLPRLSPNRRWVAFASFENGRNDVYVAPFPRFGARTRVSPRGGSWPRWRRDGEELFYVAADGRLTAVPVKGGSSLGAGEPVPLFQLRAKSGRGYAYDVSADGQRILVNAPGEGNLTRPVTLVDWRSSLR